MQSPRITYLTGRTTNLLHTALLFGGMTLLLGTIGWLIAGAAGLLLLVALAAAGILFSSAVPVELSLRMIGAVRFAPRQAPHLHRTVEDLADRAGLDFTPVVALLPTATPNALTLGAGRQAAIAVTEGLVATMTPRELAGTIAHEIAHVKAGDTSLMSAAATIQRATSFLSTAGQFLLLLQLPLMLFGAVAVPWLLVALLYFAPLFSTLLTLALSRTREFDADLTAARLTGDPGGLAAALRKLERGRRGFWAGLLLPGRRAPRSSLLSSHPPTAERVRRLADLEAETTDECRGRATPVAVTPVATMPVVTMSVVTMPVVTMSVVTMPVVTMPVVATFRFRPLRSYFPIVEVTRTTGATPGGSGW